MESVIPMNGFQQPLQRPLSRLYNDTKKSSDFVKEPIQNEDDPELKALYRKLCIQKDRFVGWGLEWSDSNQSAEIDENLSRAGLSEVVGSIMSTIKDILAEAEPLWQSSKRVVQGRRLTPDTKGPLVKWDKERFKDLILDLTASIDTLYDLSRTRSSSLARLTAKASSKTPSEGHFRSFESTRMQTPQQIDPKTLTHLQPLQGNGDLPALREVVYMSKTAYAEIARKTTNRQPWAPLLLEYAPFDPIYSTTGIMPPMARFEKLSAGLQQDSKRSPAQWTGLPRLFGYFEDMDNSRLGLLYHFPPSFNALVVNRLVKNPPYNLPTLSELLLRADSEPPLEAKFRFAYNFTNTVFDMHARGVTHGDLLDKNISFCRLQSRHHSVGKGELDIRRPLLSSFEVFPEDDSSPSPQKMIWRHPLDPRSKPTSPSSSSADERIVELYSLAMALISIGLWTKLEKIASDPASPSIPESALNMLTLRCGTLYTKAVQTCWKAVDGELAGGAGGESLLSSVQMRVTRYLEACCILDGVSGLEERMEDEPRPPKDASSRVKRPSSIEKKSDSKHRPPSDSKNPAVQPTPIPSIKLERPSTEELGEAMISMTKAENKDATESKTKMRLYPHVPLPPDVVEKWNMILMPQINQALRSFYRKHPESVEISLESVGPSPHQTRPTVLVVCSSVGKVRAILNKKLGGLFDETTGFALRVCRGHVIRSRRQATGSSSSGSQASQPEPPSDDEEEEIEAVNPKFEEKPSNGASIGAWIGDRHLPPVSFGGLVIVDDKPYGMTVHHMLDDPDRDFGLSDNVRSSAVTKHLTFQEFDANLFPEDEEPGYELSDSESETYSETDLTSDSDSDKDEEEEFNEPGDIPGIEPGCGEGYFVTQPAMDDVEEGFYPCPETEDEDHLDTYTLGELYASSGIRRKQVNGLVHEVDWALFEFAEGRQPGDNMIPRFSQMHTQKRDGGDNQQLQPTTVAPWSTLAGMEVQCVARSSGLQAGKILPALTSVKIYGRTSPSHTYQVVSTPSSAGDRTSFSDSSISLGIPGDSGAWIVDRHHGQLCGHVLAWSQRKRVAYICAMDILLHDIAQTLEATDVRLPGGEAVLTPGADASEPSHPQSEYTAKPAAALDVIDDIDDTIIDDIDDTDDESADERSQNSTPPALVRLSSMVSLDTSALNVTAELPRITRNLGNVSIRSTRLDVLA